MKLKTKIIAVSVFLGLFAGAIDTLVDSIFFYRDVIFFDLMVFDVPDSEIYTRFLILLTFIIFGFAVGHIISRLENALFEIKILSGLLPICSFCKKIRDEKGYWNQIESYIRDHSEAEFSHGICDECYKKQKEEIDKLYPPK